MKTALTLALIMLTVTLAGCASGADDTATASKTYQVPVEAAHALSGDDRTITVKVTQGGKELGKGTYSTAGESQDDFKTIFTVAAQGGALKIQAFEGSNPLNFKSIDPARCTDPNFQIHVVDGAVHLWSNCD